MQRPRLDRILCGGLLLALAATAPGRARADGPGAAYDPPVGSRWAITSAGHEERVLAGKTVLSDTTRKEEFTIVGKKPEGWRVDFVLRSYEASGESKTGAAGVALFGAVRDVVIHAALDPAGKPQRIENLAEVQAAFDRGFDRMLEVIGDAQVRAKTRAMLQGYLASVTQDPESAAQAFLDDLALFAVAQNTGLKPGEERRTTEQSPSPFGGDPLKLTSVLRLAEADPAGDKLRYVQTDIFDPVEMKAMTLAIIQRLGLAEGDSAAEFEKLMKEVSLSMEGGATFEVEHGMTRRVAQDSRFALTARGVTVTKHEHIAVTVTPMP
ncbi:MAG TPA: hypothetical protein VMB84_04075 [Stellaceae bacterium]|nr:hypothetical protein [Stellaceae bacterium]